jgi:hypothetical protein
MIENDPKGVVVPVDTAALRRLAEEGGWSPVPNAKTAAIVALCDEVDRLREALVDALTGDMEPGELRPCPFCGGDAERVDIPEACSENDLSGEPNAGGSFIRCVKCDACTSLEFGRKETLEERWNSRFIKGVPALIAELEKRNG